MSGPRRVRPCPSRMAGHRISPFRGHRKCLPARLVRRLAPVPRYSATSKRIMLLLCSSVTVNVKTGLQVLSSGQAAPSGGHAAANPHSKRSGSPREGNGKWKQPGQVLSHIGGCRPQDRLRHRCPPQPMRRGVAGRTLVGGCKFDWPVNGTSHTGALTARSCGSSKRGKSPVGKWHLELGASRRCAVSAVDGKTRCKYIHTQYRPNTTHGWETCYGGMLR